MASTGDVLANSKLADTQFRDRTCDIDANSL